MTRKHILITLFVLVAAGLTPLLILSRNSGTPTEDVSPTQSASETEPSDSEESDIQEPNDVDEPEEKKSPPAVTTVSEKPILSNSYGQVEVAPIENNQLVSSSCSTEANVECILAFTNQSSGEEVAFEGTKSDAQGVAVWEWNGGTDVGSGAWTVTAKVGDTKSNPETIYIR